MKYYTFPRRPIERTCEQCGQPLKLHPGHHTLCRRCYGYARLAQLLPRLVDDIKAVRP